MIRIPITAIRKKAIVRPPGYEQDILSRGVVVDGFVELTEGAWRELVAKYKDSSPPSPTLYEMLSNFKRATAEWKDAGFPLVSWRAFWQRYSSCRVCPHWRGLSCGICGCTDIKLFLATAECPLPEPDKRWRAMIPPTK